MADQEYNFVYKSDNSDILGKTNVVIRALRLLDSVIDRLTPKLAKLFSGAGKSAGTASKGFEKAAASIRDVEKAAGAATPAVQALGQATGQLRQAAGGAAASTGRATTSVMGFTAQVLAMRAAREVFSEVLDLSRELEAHWQKMAAEASEFRDSLRELASLKGESGPNNDVAADILALSLDTGMVPEKAKEFAASYENIGPTVREKGHYQPADATTTPGQLEKDVIGEAGRTARRLQIDEKAAGEAIGTAGMFHTFRSKEDAMEQFGGAMTGLSLGKLEYTPGVRALNKAMAKLGDEDAARAEGARAGNVGSYAEGGVYMGALSLGTGTADQAHNRMVQLSRVLNPDLSNEEGNKALADAGVRADMTDPEKLIQLGKYLKTQGVSDPKQWLATNKLGTVATREATTAALKTTDVLEKRLAAVRESRKTNATGKATVAANDGFMATDRTATAAQVEAVTGVMNKVEGIEGAEELEKAKKAAEERIRLKDPEAHSLKRGVLHAINAVPAYLGYGVGATGLEQEIGRDGAIPTLEKEARRVGVDPGKFPGLRAGDYQTRARSFTALSDAVKAKGGDPIGMADLTAAARKRVEATRPGAIPVGRAAVPAPADVPATAALPAVVPGAPGRPGAVVPVPGAVAPAGRAPGAPVPDVTVAVNRPALPAPPAGAPGRPGLPGAPGAAPAGPPADPEGKQIQREQLAELKKLNARVGPAAPAGPRPAPRPRADAPDVNPGR